MEASFGNVLLVLSRIGAPDVLQAALDSANFHEAEDWLAAAGEDQLRTMLAEARPWD
jgi:hypothetical protein